jgi:hypothetical protein
MAIDANLVHVASNTIKEFNQLGAAKYLTDSVRIGWVLIQDLQRLGFVTVKGANFIV